MTIDKQKLKALAEAANAVTTDVNITMAVGCAPEEVKAVQDYLQVAMPQSILALLAEIERLEGFVLRRREKEVEYDEALCKVANQRDQLQTENEALRAMAGEIYQVLGSLDAPENALDQVSAAANGLRLPHETVLPFFPDEHEALRKDAERYRWLRVDARPATELDAVFNTYGVPVDEAIDAAMAKEANHG